jgi:L-aspartate oxidase
VFGAPPRAAGHRVLLDLNDIRNSLRSLMWRRAGITRDTSALAEAARQVDFWCGYALSQVFVEPGGWTLQNMLTVARLLIAAASERNESRGVHTRSDFPQTDPAWARHIAFVCDPGPCPSFPPDSRSTPLAAQNNV